MRWLYVVIVAAALSACSKPAALPFAAGGRLLPDSSSGGLRVLFNFDQRDGAEPTGLAVFKSTLYGTTEEGGAYGGGVLYEFSSSGSEQILYSFGGSRLVGYQPAWPPIGYRNALYGTTELGGNNSGTIYKYARGKFSVLARFLGYPNGGAYPNGLTVLNGSFYGTTFGGGSSAVGSIFALTGSTLKTIYNFPNNNTGPLEPHTPLLAYDGALYGTSNIGGVYGYGTVFKVTPAGDLTVIHSFGNGKDGRSPEAPLTNVNGEFYGTTSFGGSDSYGTVFEITPSGRERVIYSFSYYGKLGNEPLAGLVYSKGELYGTTSGKEAGDGTIFALEPSGKNPRVLYDLGHYAGSSNPNAALSTFDGLLYGTSSQGGTAEGGFIFRASP
ncbi:MAG TPA: choice-of-anchor tandem repeat GloVer-containing protein [Candidatus Cybelea sp.]|jgi:uncharacterized repeat protein (TIGR03803 family)|nr:choice-of-anchor tandem repeat GloVer-containing protein [Candidatus Cybelea sp.]